MRLLSRSASLTSLMALVLCAGSEAAQPRRPDEKRILCVASDWGRPRCTTLGDLKRQLSPQQYAQLLARLNRLVRELGLDPTRDALLPCSGTARVPAVNLAGGFDAGRTKKLTPADLGKITSVVSTCRASIPASAGGGARPGGTSSYDSWAAETVQEVDSGMAGCRDRTNPWIAQSSEVSDFEKRKRDSLRVLRDSKPEAPAPTPAPTGIENSLLFGGTGSGGGGTSGGGTGSGTGSTGGADPCAAASGIGLASCRITQELLAAMKQQGSKDATPAPSAAPTTAPTAGTPAPTAGSGTPSSPNTPCERDTGCTPTCEERQAAWDLFKGMCEQSDWKAYPCVDFLRKVNGCVDITLINPGPEGDLTCPAWGRETREERAKRAWSEQCKRKSWIMVPVDDGRPLCADPGLLDARPAMGIDPCNNPRVLPDPESCGGVRDPSLDPGRHPQPDPR